MFSLEIEVLESPGELVIRLQDVIHLKLDKITQLRQHLVELVKSKQNDTIIVNLNRVTFCSSYTLNLLLWMQQALKHRPERIRLCNLQPDTLEVLRLSKTDRFFDLFETEAAARAQPSPSRSPAILPGLPHHSSLISK